MDKRIKAKWLRALRSGKYIQGDGALRRGSDGGTYITHCCLGVLCDIHSKETKKDWSIRGGPHAYMGAASKLPQAVMLWAGLTDKDPNVIIDGEEQKLSSHNDGACGRPMAPFKVIAKAISKQL